MTKATPGSVISGTHQTADLIRAFAAEYERLSPDDAKEEIEEAYKLADEADLGDRHAENANEALYQLHDMLNSLAPEGHYFGAHEGDGADFGFWPHEEEEDAE